MPSISANQDDIRFEILEDGTVKIETDEVSGANHLKATQLINYMGDLLGGEVVVKSKRGEHHHHSHGEGEHHHHH